MAMSCRHRRILRRCAVVALGLAAAFSGSGCARHEPPRPPPPRSTPPAPLARALPVENAIAKPNIEALTAALRAKGHTVTAALDGKGRVRDLSYRAWEGSAAFVNAFPERYLRALMKAHGDALGYGTLGEGSNDITLEDAIEGTSMILVPYPKAEGCPGLAVVFRYSYGIDDRGLVGMPMGWEFLCPTEPGALDRMREVPKDQRGDVARSRQVTAALDREPLVQWLVSHGYGRPTQVDHLEGMVRVRLPEIGMTGARSREALAREVAEGAAAASGLPKLDKITVRTTPGTADRPKEVSGIELAEAKASHGICVEPRVVVSLRASSGPNDTRPPSVEELKVFCLREEVGASPPADSARVLPRTFATSPEYLVHCQTTSYAWGYSNTGLVVDRRGDVYSYSGGTPTSGQTASGLAAQLRHGKAFHGTLPAADVERLVGLIPKVAREKWKSTPRRAFDGPEGSCQYLQQGATKGALVKVPIHAYDNAHEAIREGDATREASQILDRARAL